MPEESQLTNDRSSAGATFSLGLNSQASSKPSLASLEHVSSLDFIPEMARETPDNVHCFPIMLWQREAGEGPELSEVVLVSVWSENTALSVLLMTIIPFLSSVVGLLLPCFESVTISAELPLKTGPW